MVRPPGSLESDLLLVVSRHATDPAGVHRVELTVPGYDGVGDLSFDLDATRPDLAGLSLLTASQACQAARRPNDPPCPVKGLQVGRALVDAILADAPAELAEVVRSYGEARSHLAPRRIVVVTEASGSTAGHLLFEAWEHTVFTERVRVVRWRNVQAPAPTVVARPPRPRALILVGDVGQSPGAADREKEYVQAARALQQALPGAGLQVTTWITAGVIQAGDEKVTTDWQPSSETDLTLKLAQQDFHVVVYLGHSDAEGVAPGQEATALQLAFGPPERRVTRRLAFGDLAEALRGRSTRLLVLFACVLRAELADGLLQAVDHVIGVPSQIDPNRFPPLALALGNALQAAGTAGDVALCMRATLANGKSLGAHEGWQVVHYARTLHERLLWDEHQALLHDYRVFVRNQHARLEGPAFANFEGTDAALERVYVQLELEATERFRDVLGIDDDLAGDADPGRRQAAAGKRSRLGAGSLHRPLPLSELIRVRTDTAPEGQSSWVTGRWVVLALPGAGKTTILRKLAFDLTDADDVLPVYLHLGLWPRDARGQPQDFAAVLEQVFPGLPALFEHYDRGRGGRCVVLLDGLDEIDDVSRFKAAFDRLVARVQSPIVVASRKLGYSVNLLPQGDGHAFRPARILSLNENDHTAEGRTRAHDKKRELLRKFYRANGETESAAQTRADHTVGRLENRLWELTNTPLFVHLVGFLELKGCAPVQFRHEVLRDVIACMLEGKHRRDPVAIPNPPLVRRALACLAFAFTCQRTTRLARQQVLDLIGAWPDASDAAVKPLGTELLAIKEWVSSPAAFLDLAAKRTSLVAAEDTLRADAGETAWRFWLKSIQDALAAEHLFEAVFRPAHRAGLEDALDVVWRTLDPLLGGEQGRLGAWGEVLALFTAYLPEPQRAPWIERLAKADADLALRALAFADLGGELVARVLGLQGDRAQRARVYRDVAARLAGDPITLVPTLVACVRATTDGNDLYVLDELLAQLDTRHPGVATTERKALFAHFGAGVRKDKAAESAKVQAAFARLPDGAETWCVIEPGWYQRGSPKSEGYSNERPAMPVQISKAFVIGATTITQEQYALFDPSYKPRWPGEHLPATEITWFAATMFARWLGQHLGVEGRLPTEAEWEYACRAQRCADAEAVRGASWLPYWCGAQLPEGVAWYGKGFQGPPRAAHVGQANAFGLRNVHGNVWEWCADSRGAYQADEDGIAKDPVGPLSGSLRVLRGGSCWDDAGLCRSACRFGYVPGIDNVDFGFRVLLSSPPTR